MAFMVGAAGNGGGRLVCGSASPQLVSGPIDTAIEFTLLDIGLFLVGMALTYPPRLDTAQFSPVQHFIESIVLLALALCYFRRLLQPPITLAPLVQEPMFWVSAGVVLYFAGNSLIFLTSNITLAYSLALSRNV